MLVARLPRPKRYNSFMTQYRFYYPIEVRYGDLDPQGHVNNARYLTYFEQTRVQYLIHLGLFDKGQSFLNVGIILAEARITFLSPLGFGEEARVGARTTRLGNKSFDMVYSLQGTVNAKEIATGSAVLVSYDYRSQTTIPIPDHWRKCITEFDGL
jgi:acyl-CoA thioester hydrolase